MMNYSYDLIRVFLPIEELELKPDLEKNDNEFDLANKGIDEIT